MDDDGCDGEGRPNQQRQHMAEMLRKRIMVDGAEVPVFRLAEPPPPCAYPNDKAGMRMRAVDRFDRDVLKDEDGRWRLPSEQWLATSDKLHAVEVKRDEDFTQQAAERLKGAAGDAVGALMSLVSQQATTKAARQKGAAAP